MAITFVLLSLLLLLVAHWAIGQNTTTTTSNTTDEDLESMSDQDLEFICIERGFELIRSESEDELTHDDYVDAAKRCLAIEEDMNEILEQNPELAEELLSEVDRLKAEKERMEQERQKMLAEKERLEEQIAQQNQKQQYANDNDRSPRMWGAQAETKSNNSASLDPMKEANAGKGTTAFASHKSSTDSGSSVDKDPSASSTTASSSSDNETTDDDIPIDDYDYVHEDVNGTTPTEADECATNETSTEDSTSSSAASKTDENTQFSLTGFIQEVVAEFEKDVRLITRLVYPVVKPLLGAKDFAWKYLRSLFDGAKRHAELFQQNKSKGQGEGAKQDGGSAELTDQKQTNKAS